MHWLLLVFLKYHMATSASLFWKKKSIEPINSESKWLLIADADADWYLTGLPVSIWVHWGLTLPEVSRKNIEQESKGGVPQDEEGKDNQGETVKLCVEPADAKCFFLLLLPLFWQYFFSSLFEEGYFLSAIQSEYRCLSLHFVRTATHMVPYVQKVFWIKCCLWSS